MRDWTTYLREHLDLPAMRGHRDERAIREIADHLEDLVADAVAHGCTEAEAETRALAWLGDPAAAASEIGAAEPGRTSARLGRWVDEREHVLRTRGRLGRWLSDGLRDVRTGVRSLARRPLFAGVSVLVMALGIGATTAIFTLVDAVVLAPLPFEEPDRLVAIRHSAPSRGIADAGQCAAWHFTYEDENSVFESLGMFNGDRAVISGEGTPEAVLGLEVTRDVLTALRLRPVIGRAFRSEDHDPDGERTVMLGLGYWRTHFGADPGVLGRTVRVDGNDSRIIGVAPAEVRLLGRDPAIIRPLRFRRSELFVGNIGFGSVARLRDGVTLAEAQADLARILPLAWEKFPGGPVADASDPARHRVEVRPFKDTVVGSSPRLLWVVFGGVVIVLLIAFANVANLMLVHFEARRGEMAVRTALGAGRARVVWEHLKESLPLAAAGGALGLALGQLGLRRVLALGGADLPRADTVALSPAVVAVTVLLTLASGVLLGWIPSRRVGRDEPIGELREQGRSRMVDRGSRRLQSLLTVGQVALVLVLLAASGLMVRSFRALSRVDPGFGHPDDIVALQLYVPRQEVQPAAEVATTYEAIVRRLELVPGVRAVGLASALPMTGYGNINPLFVQGDILDAAANGTTRRHKWIGGGYLEAMEIPLVVGRGLTWDDAHDRAPVALLSARLATELFGSPEAALGRRVAARPDPPVWKEVVGVVADVHEDGAARVPPAMVYWPQVTTAFWQGNTEEDVLAWRAAGIALRGDRLATAAALDAVRRAVWDVNPNLPVVSETMPALMRGWTDRTSFCMVLLVLAAGVGVVLAVVGVYAVVAYGVARRTVELGLRMAVGAGRFRVRVLVLRQGLVLGVAGVALGLAGALALSRVMVSLLFGVTATDPATHLTAAAGLVGVVGLASYLPARRASNIDPMEALRTE